MRASRIRSGLVVAAVGASILGGMLWFLSGLAIFAVSWASTRWESAIALLIPPTVPVGTWQAVSPWNIVLPGFGALMFAGLLALALVGLLCWRNWWSASPGIRFVVVWGASVAAAFVTAGVWALGNTIANSEPTGLEWAFRTAQPELLASGFFGILWGWAPAIVVVAVLRHPRAVPADSFGEETRTTHAAVARVGRWSLPVTLAIVAVLTVGAGAGVVVGQPASVRAGRIAAGGTPSGLPAPSATPTPVPTTDPPPDVAPTAVPPGPGWCAPEETSLTASGVSGAMGHRAITLVLVNRSSSSCVVDGYPDLAFADTGGDALTVQVQYGSSYTATDPGAAAVALAPGASVESQLGWEATGASTGTAAMVWAAAYPGAQRTRLAVETDITAGSEVSVTAWAGVSTTTQAG